jgi:hypothetical protein
MTPTRRGLMGSALGLAGALAVPARAGIVTGRRRVALFDPASDAALAFAGAARGLGADVRAIEGDRIRLARALLADPRGIEAVAGLGRYADFLLIAGCGEEAGWRVAAYGTHGRTHRCEGALRPATRILDASGTNWPQAMAELLVRADGGAGSVRRTRPSREMLTSWLMVRRGAGSRA